MSGSTGPDRRRRHGRKGPIAVGVILLLAIITVLVWRWDWFIPLVEAQASAALGRKVTLQHLHVRLGRTVHITADGVEVAGLPDAPRPLAKIAHLTAWIEVWPLLRHRQVVLPLIDVDHPDLDLEADREGKTNYALGSKTSGSSASKSPQPSIGIIRIEDGHAHVVQEKLRAKFDVALATRGTPDPAARPINPEQGEITADAKGTYAGQPITAGFIGGAILSMRDPGKPYPVNLHVENGPTKVVLKGTIEQPLSLGGARLQLLFSGPDMSLLYPLTGVPIPKTPPYRVSGALDYSKERIEFNDFAGRVGSSDLNGSIRVKPGRVADIDADLSSRRVDLADLAGFIGANPGRRSTPDATPAQKRDVAKADNSGNVLPTKKINLPKLRSANVHLKYKGDHIEGKYVPLDNIVAVLNVEDGRIRLDRLDFAVGSGTLASSVDLDPMGDTMRAKAHVDFHRIDLSRLLQATHTFKGRGIIGGRADITSTGSSVADLLGNGSGGVTLVMSGEGNVSALLPDIAGLEFGNALLSALGMPNRADVECFIMDMPLKNGILSANTFVLQTSEARSTGAGSVNLRNETIDFSLTTRSTHFSVGSLPGPIHITGKLGKPGISPGTEVVARAGAAAGLGIVLAPLALLPTIQFGVGDAGVCEKAMGEVRSHGSTKPPSRHHR